MTIASAVDALGGLAHISQLHGCGHSRSTIARAVAREDIVRVCSGWVATSRAPLESVVAVLHGGKLSGPTALAQRGDWDACDTRIHVQLPPNGRGSPQNALTPLSHYRREARTRHGVTLHWRNEVALDRAEPRWRASTIDSLVTVARVASVEHFVASVESCLQSRRLSAAGLPALARGLPQRLQGVLDILEPRSGSGLESIFRQRIAPLGCRIDVQVEFPGIGPRGRAGSVDFVLDDWLVIEVDGDAFHDPAVDRVRNGLLVRLGYRWHRFGYQQIMSDWPKVEETVIELLRYPPPRAETRRNWR